MIYRFKLLLPAMLLALLYSCSGSSQKDASAAKEPSSENRAGAADSAAESAPAGSPASEEQLRVACLDGEESKVAQLIAGGTSVNAMDAEGRTSLMFAAFNGHSGIVLKLLDAGAVVDRRDLMGRTALLYAATGPFSETVSILLGKGADPNVVDSNEHFSPLMHAAAEGNLDVVKVLVKAGSRQDLKDVDGDDAVSFARQAGHVEVVTYLESFTKRPE